MRIVLQNSNSSIAMMAVVRVAATEQVYADYRRPRVTGFIPITSYPALQPPLSFDYAALEARVLNHMASSMGIPRELFDRALMSGRGI